MFSRIFIKLSMLLLFVSAPYAHAEENTSSMDQIAVMLGVQREQINPGPIAGLYEVQVGSKIYYLSEDGKYLINGSIIDLAKSENLTENRLRTIRKGIVDGIGDSQMIVFKANDPKHTITVFTDIDCGYCRKLHSQIKDYNDLGINVQYLFYPRTGIGSASYQKAVSVWCSKDRNDAMTRAKSGEDVPNKDCENPVAKHFALGTELGIRGTPAILTDGGDLLPGYIPPVMLKKELDNITSEELAATKGNK